MLPVLAAGSSEMALPGLSLDPRPRVLCVLDAVTPHWGCSKGMGAGAKLHRDCMANQSMYFLKKGVFERIRLRIRGPKCQMP